ncbi:MAG: NPCBM/NEW2 domain-containing protein [Pirellulales bacterium]|nr:NPCBM/NEW2 domain-containing protein [Pirellulales bacterium]
MTRLAYCGFSIILISTLGWNTSSASEPSGFVVKSPTIEARISAAGEIEALKFAAETAARPVKAATMLAGCRREGATQVTKLDGGGVQFEKQFVQEKGGGRAAVVEKFLPGQESIRWELEIRGQSTPWSTPIETWLDYPRDEPSRFWTAWGDPRPDGKDWTNPLRPAEWLDREFLYGGRYYKFYKEPSTFALPLASILDKNKDSGLSLILSPDDLVLTLKMRTAKRGSLVFSREYYRLGEGDVVRLAMDLVAHPADWRGGLGWLVRRYPRYFDPPNPKAAQLAGCGAYSSHTDINDIENLMRMAFRVNWKASFDFPFMGMFVPPVASDTEEWVDFMNQKITIAQMRESAAALRRAGFYLLNYFNVTEFGARTKYPAPPRKALKDEDLWKDSNDFLHYALGKAILLGAEGKPIFSWEGCVVMDPGEQVYRDFLIEQARRHVEKFPDSSGICIDRLDWLILYNRQRDDGLTWYEGKPARCLAVSWRELMQCLSPVMHDAGKVIFVNTMYPRLDIMRQVDGVYDEHGQHPHSLNVSTILALNKPYIAWTWQVEELDKNPDEYFQRHLHLGAYLTAPVPGNDHTILPGSQRDRHYLDYGPLLDAMRGKRWLLKPHVVRVEGEKALANAFEVPGGYVVPVTFGGKAASAQVVLKDLPQLPGQNSFRVEAIHPGTEKPIALQAEAAGNLLRVDVPLKRGCAMLVLSYAWMEPKAAFFHGSAKIELGSTLGGASFRYTLDGTEPTPQSPAYSTPIELEKTTVVKATAFLDGKKVGATLEREYVKIPPAAPIISATHLFFDDTAEVAVETPHPTEGETIHYTLDGSAPTKASPRYSRPVRIDRTVHLQAVRATAGGLSPASSATFTRRGPKPPKPDVSLADLKPLKATVGWGGHPRMNCSIGDKPLTLAGKVYERGVGVHADSELEYELKPEYARFVSVIGLDDEMLDYGKGNIIFEIEIDGKKMLNSPVIRAGEYMYADVPIPAGSRKIRLAVFGGGINIGIDGAHGDWADAGFMVNK